MKTNALDPEGSGFLHNFVSGTAVSYKDLKSYYLNFYPLRTGNDFRRLLYRLMKESLLIPLGVGTYFIQDTNSPTYLQKTSFAPKFSPFLLEIKNDLISALPFSRFVVWETKVLHEYMVHQPNINMVILEAEKEASGTAFNILSDKYPNRAYLSPGHIIIDRYALQQKEPIIITKLISRTPKGRKDKDFRYAKIENILVDIFVDDEKFYFFQGSEMIAIFEEAFRKHQIDERSMFWYANRRSAKERLSKFIHENTNVKLLTKHGDIS